MTILASLMDHNAEFATTDPGARATRWAFVPRRLLYIVTCIDPRVDPSAFLGLDIGDAIVSRSMGARVTPLVIRDMAFMSFQADTRAPDEPHFEAAVIHHTDCGTQLLSDQKARGAFASRTGYDEAALAPLAVVDPYETVRIDVALLVRAPQLSPRLRVSGHVYDVATGRVVTVVPATPSAARG